MPKIFQIQQSKIFRLRRAQKLKILRLRRAQKQNFPPETGSNSKFFRLRRAQKTKLLRLWRSQIPRFFDCGGLKSNSFRLRRAQNNIFLPEADSNSKIFRKPRSQITAIFGIWRVQRAKFVACGGLGSQNFSPIGLEK